MFAIREEVYMRLDHAISQSYTCEQLDRANCMITLIYKMRNCGRIGWTPEDRNLTAGYTVLKHSMCVMFLNKSV